MNTKEYVHANREAWNEAQAVHAKNRTCDIVTDIKEGRLHFDLNLLGGYDLRDKSVGQFCCNNGRETLSMSSLGARECVGFDISDSFIDEARVMSEKLGFNCSFIQADVCEITSHREYFDLVIFTAGALPWLQDLNSVFRTVSEVLKPSGTLIISDWHPFLGMFAMPGEEDYDPAHPEKIAYSYFRKDPIIEDNGMDYVGGTVYQSKKFYSFNHSLSEIITAIIRNGLRITELEESADNVTGSPREMAEGKEFPQSFRLTAVKG
jgi:ubiquinone/menaquinone biosynthesis C-methylase UbiE